MKRLFVYLLPLIALCSCSKDVEDSGNLTGSIYGIVTEEGSSQPMEALSVELYKEGALLLKTVTAVDGSYEFNDITAGEYSLVAKGLSYEDAQFAVIVEAGRQARADMQLKKINTYMDITTDPITMIIGDNVTFNGSIDSQNSTIVTEWGFLYSTSSNLNNGTKVIATKKSNGSYDFSITATVSQLPPENYYVAAFATNKYGTAYGNTETFRISGLPHVTTLPASSISNGNATLNGRIDYSGNPTFTERGFVYSATFQNPTIEDAPQATTKRVVSGTSTDFSANISGLAENKTYYARAYAINSEGVSYGESLSISEIHQYGIVLSEDGFMVQREDLSTGVYWSSANELCQNSRIGGFSDWRLPTLGELTILYQRHTEGKIPNMQNARYWSSTAVNSYGYFYQIDFTNKDTYSSRGDKIAGCVRAVRSIK